MARRDDSALAWALRKTIPARWRPVGYLTRLTQRRSGCRVMQGPFQGTRYVDRAIGSAYIPKLLGIYERELNSVIEKACRLGLDLIVDLGAAEGYYAVGMARRNPQSRVVAFEADAQGRMALERMAKLNEAGARVAIRGRCEPDDLAAALEDSTGRLLVICDVEGHERIILDPSAVPALARAWMIVEVHEFLCPGITRTLTEKFSATHRIEHLWQEDRFYGEYPFRTVGTSILPRRYLNWAVSEWRPERMAWLWMEPRAGPNEDEGPVFALDEEKAGHVK